MTKAVVGLMLVLMCVCGLTTFAQTPKTIALADATIADRYAAFDAGTLTSQQLVEMCLARIRAYDRQGPSVRAVLTVNSRLRADGAGPTPNRWTLMKREAGSGGLEDYRQTVARDHALPMVRALIEGLLKSQTLDAIVYPTLPKRPQLLTAPPDPPGGTPGTPVNLANLSGFPDLIVPAGFTGDGLPVGLSFFGPAFSEPRLLALGYGFEQATHARRLPVHTPRLPADVIRLP